MAHAHEPVIRQTMHKGGIKLTGTLMACGPCNLWKAQRKRLPKVSHPGYYPGERMFMDSSGPYAPTLGGNTTWIKFRDHHTKMNWNVFIVKAENTYLKY